MGAMGSDGGCWEVTKNVRSVDNPSRPNHPQPAAIHDPRAGTPALLDLDDFGQQRRQLGSEKADSSLLSYESRDVYRVSR